MLLMLLHICASDEGDLVSQIMGQVRSSAKANGEEMLANVVQLSKNYQANNEQMSR